MLKITLSIAVCFLFFVSNSFAQECGKGYFQITFNTKNSVTYEIFPVTPKNSDYGKETVQMKIAETFFPYFATNQWFWLSMPKVNDKVAETFLANYKPENFAADYDNSQNPGKAADGVIRFSTSEGNSAPFLMKISAEKFKTAYYIGSFLGGCKTNKKIDLESNL